MKNFKKIFYVIIIGFSQLNFAHVPGLDQLTLREETKLKSGFIIAYLANNIEALKTYDKSSNSYNISKNAYAFVVLMCAIISFQRESNEGEADKQERASWNYGKLGDIRKIIKNGFCASTGALFGVIVPPLIQAPYYVRKLLNSF